MTEFAPDWPGISPKWTSSAKSGVGTSLHRTSRVWFTISHGILNEVYYPQIDYACTRDFGFLVTDGVDFFSEEKRDAQHSIQCVKPGVPAYELRSQCLQGKYALRKRICTDPNRDIVLQEVVLEDLRDDHEFGGVIPELRLFAILAPHIGNKGWKNTGWVGDYKGHPMLFAERDGIALAVGISTGWRHRSVGFVGFSDGWQDLQRHKQLTWNYSRAENGNIALSGEIMLQGTQPAVLALGFGRTASEAGQRVRACLDEGFESSWAVYQSQWHEWQSCMPAIAEDDSDHLYRTSLMVLKTHEAKRFRGGIIASLSVPWGFNKGDEDLGGYHLVWPRDLVQNAGALLAAGAIEDVQCVLDYLRSTQECDGHWPQNMWLDGTAYWNGVQLDEAALPVLLVDLCRRELSWDDQQLRKYWPMVRKAAEYIVIHGPATEQDRWEEDAGYTPFSLATEISALLIAAEFANRFSEPSVAEYLRETADYWNDSIETWTYSQGSDLANQLGVDGYYVRIAPMSDQQSLSDQLVPIKNQPEGSRYERATNVISPDALSLVRFGLRAPDDPRILNTVKVIDHILKRETACGPGWYRYNHDGYGEHADGAPFDGQGVGRPWPLLTGERAHYELAAGNNQLAMSLLQSFGKSANAGGMLPEQIWDSGDLPERELFSGKPSGSAMPLVWAHAEYVKLRRSLKDSRVFDMPDQTRQRYQMQGVTARISVWKFSSQFRSIPVGRILRIEVNAPATIIWTHDAWNSMHKVDAAATGLSTLVADLPTSQLSPGESIEFTLYWQQSASWEGQNFVIDVGVDEP